MTAKTRWCLFVLLSFAPAGVARAAEPTLIDAVWLAKIKTEGKVSYQTRFAKYQALCLRLEETDEIRADKVPGGVGTMKYVFTPHTRRERFICLNENFLRERIRTDDDRPDRPQIKLECDNGDYYFTLTKAQEDADYALIEYAPGIRKNPVANQGFGLHSEVWGHARDVFSAVENDGKFTLRRLQFDEAKKLLKVEFVPAKKDPPFAIVDSVYLDPDHDWRVVERSASTTTTTSTAQWTYGIVLEGLEFPTGFKILSDYKVANAPPNIETTIRVLSLKVTDKTPDDFRLAAFGLPEPVDVKPRPKPIPWYLWIVAAAGGCAVLAVAFAYLQRRRQARQGARPIPGGIS